MIVKKDKHSTDSEKPLKVAFYIRPDYLEQMSPESQNRYQKLCNGYRQERRKL